MRKNAYFIFGLVLIFVLMAVIGIIKSDSRAIRDGEVGPPTPDRTCLDGKLWHADSAKAPLMCMEVMV